MALLFESPPSNAPKNNKQYADYRIDPYIRNEFDYKDGPSISFPGDTHRQKPIPTYDILIAPLHVLRYNQETITNLLISCVHFTRMHFLI